jgi:hypothetical protein
MDSLSSALEALRPRERTRPMVYADANVPAPAVRDARDRLDWDVTHVLEEPRWRRASDVEHYRRARELRRTLITFDHDYFDESRFPTSLSGGVVVFTAPDARALARLLSDLDALLRLGDRVPGLESLPLVGRKLHLFPGWTDYA